MDMDFTGKTMVGAGAMSKWKRMAVPKPAARLDCFQRPPSDCCPPSPPVAVSQQRGGQGCGVLGHTPLVADWRCPLEG